MHNGEKVFKFRLKVLHFGKYFKNKALQLLISSSGFSERSILFNIIKKLLMGLLITFLNFAINS